jgi:putative DNA primase/helicase
MLVLSYLIASESRTAPVLFASYEETREHVWRPRLEAAGADLERCFMHPEVRFSRDPADAAILETLLEDTGAKVLIVDPIMNHTARSIYYPTWLRQDLRAMEELIGRNQVAAIFLHHLIKSVSVHKHPLAALSGSAAGLPAVARSVYLFSRSPEDEDVLVLANAEKHNLGPQPDSHAFQIETRRIPVLATDDKTIVEKDVPYLQHLGPTQITARDLLPVMRGTFKPPSQLDRAKDFLIKTLEDRHVPAKDVKTAALLASVASRTLQRAATDLGIERSRQTDGTPTWSLPAELAAATAAIRAEKIRLDGEHAETHLDSDNVAQLLQLVPNTNV